MPAPLGNRFWELRTKHGRKKLFSNPKLFWGECCKYFQWVMDNPLEEEKAFHSEGMITKTKVQKLRVMTISGLCLYLNINRDTWNEYRKLKDFSGVIAQAEAVITEQKFSGAAAGLLNANIISRDLGMADKVKHEVTLEALVADSMPSNDDD